MGILIVGGFATPAYLFKVIARELRPLDPNIHIFTHHIGLDCSETTYRAFRRTLHTVENSGPNDSPLSIVAYSRGGQIAKVAAIRQPGRIHSIVTVGSPFEPGVTSLSPTTRTKILSLGHLGTLGIPGIVTTDCLAENGCCTTFWRDLTQPWPPSIKLAMLYGITDHTVQPPTDRPIEWIAANHYQLLTRRKARAATINTLKTLRLPHARTEPTEPESAESTDQQ